MVRIIENYDNQVYVFMNSNNHTLQKFWDITKLQGSNKVRNYVKISNSRFDKYSDEHNENIITLSTDYIEAKTIINDLFSGKNNEKIKIAIIKRYNKWRDAQLKQLDLKTTSKYCPDCGTQLVSNGDCPKCNNYPDWEDSI